MSDNGSSYSGGIGFTGLLTIVFIVLKLTHYIDWRWRWVLSPLLIGPLVFVLVIGLIALVVLGVTGWDNWSHRRARGRSLQRR